MNTETVLAAIVASVTEILKDVVEQVDEQTEPVTLYALEVQTHTALARIGQILLHGLMRGQGTGLVGSHRPCVCGFEQTYHDQARPLHLTTSLGQVAVERRAYYRCAECGATSSPLDEQLGVGQAGQMSRYLQEQCAWLLALLPARAVRQTLARFGWPNISASQIREHGEALGAELEVALQKRLSASRQEAGLPPAHLHPPRQIPEGERLYAAPDGVMYCTTEREPETGKQRWRELKVAAIYEARPREGAGEMPAEEDESEADQRKLPARTRILHWLRHQEPDQTVAAPDRAVRVSYVAETAAWEQFGGRLWGELWERGLERVITDLVVVADGSGHIDQVVDREFRLPDISLTRILDIAHAQQHLWAVSQAVFGEGTATGRAWVQGPLAALERGQLATVLEALETLAAQREQQAPAEAACVRKTAAYFAQRREQVDYPRFVADGRQIGSGLAESACKRFGTERMKGAGMRWTVWGAQCVATLRMFVLSERWDEVSTYCRQAA